MDTAATTITTTLLLVLLPSGKRPCNPWLQEVTQPAIILSQQWFWRTTTAWAQQ